MTSKEKQQAIAEGKTRLKLVSFWPDYWSKVIGDDVKDGRYTLAEIGTSEDGLKKLVHKGYIARGKGYLNFITINPPYWIGLIRKDVKDGRYTLAEIGTTEEILLVYLKKAKAY